MATVFGDSDHRRLTSAAHTFIPQRPSATRSVALPPKSLYGMPPKLTAKPNMVVPGPVISGPPPTPDAVVSQIEGHILKPLFDWFPSPLRLRCISPSVFSDLQRTPIYQELLASDSHVRISYNSDTRILAVRCMTTPLHDAAQPFMSRALYSSAILQPVLSKIRVVTGTDFLGFAEPYGGSTKQPDVAVRVRGSYWPTLVVESGWSEGYDDLVEDARLWLVGGRLRRPIDDGTGQLHVNAVILIYFDHKDFDADSLQPINGTLEVWRRKPSADDSTIPDIKQCLKIAFYPSLPADAPLLAFTLQEILGPQNIPPNASGDTLIHLDLKEFVSSINDDLPNLLADIQLKRKKGAEKKRQGDDARREANQQDERRRAAGREARDARAQRRAADHAN